MGAEGGAKLPLPHAFELALEHHRHGRLRDAEIIYRRILQAVPDHADALNLLGVLACQASRQSQALPLFQRAIEIAPQTAMFHAHLGLALRALGRAEEAEAALRRALSLDPALAQTHHDLGKLLLTQARTEEAVASFRRALALDGGHADALDGLGNALRLLGQAGAAESAHRAAIERSPNAASAHNNLGNALLSQARAAEAEACYRRAVVLDPNYASAHNNLGVALRERGRIAQSGQAYRRALELDPGFAEAHNNLGNLLKDQGDLIGAIACFRRAAELRPDYAVAADNLLVSLQYDPGVTADALLEAHRDYARRFAPPARRGEHVNERDPERRLRVGYVSADFLQHPVGIFLVPVLQAHARERFQIFCYANQSVEDSFTAELRATAAAWRQVHGLNDAALADRIQADGIDILVDLSGHTAGNRLRSFMLKPAPVQVSWLGYFHTTGVEAIDAVIMDPITVPAGAERWFVEELIRLPEGRFCYGPPAHAPAIAPAPAAERGFVTFGSFNNLSKLTPTVASLWSRVLNAVPRARLLLKWKSLGDEDECRRVRELFAWAGLDPRRLDLRGSSSHRAMLAEYADMDIALDPFPFCGGVTSCEALWMGVPVVTLPGERPVSRQTLGFLMALGLTELVAADADDYVDIATRLGSDAQRLATLRAGLRERMVASTLCDAMRFTRNLESAYRTLWRRWCAAGQSGRAP